LRYSATHADKHHMLYRLDAVDAYERKLVKQMKWPRSKWKAAQQGYVKLISTSNKRGQFSAKVELDMPQMFGVKREPVIVRPGDDLEQITGRAVYANCLVQAIGCAGRGSVFGAEQPGEPSPTGQSIGDVDNDAISGK